MAKDAWQWVIRDRVKASDIERPVFVSTLEAWRRQSRIAAAWAQHEAELDAQEDAAWRMFGIRVEYYQDERVVTCG